MKKVLLLGASGYIGKHVAKELIRKGYLPICPQRRNCADLKRELNLDDKTAPLWDMTDTGSIRDVMDSHPEIDAVISCIASRTGAIKDSWEVDYKLNKNLLGVIKKHVRIKFILLSAICVQKPKLHFQFAKLAFEKELEGSGLDYTIVRPTAYFKSLAGQVERVKRGKRFIVFDSGKTTSTKPISETDLAIFLVKTIGSTSSRNKILFVGGPGPALSQKEMGKIIFDILISKPKFIYFPSQIFKIISAILYPFCLFSNGVRDTREFVKIAHYYATESMLVWDKGLNKYSAEATPESGQDTIKAFYSSILKSDTNEHVLKSNRLFK